MGIRFFGMSHAKQILQRSHFTSPMVTKVPKGHFVVYIGESQKKRIVVPLSYAEEMFGFDHPMGGLCYGMNSNLVRGSSSELVGQAEIEDGLKKTFFQSSV
ncbi:hypothetical protein GIB67_007564 [Kingdonia uniflora]|uniref:Uncharacterized protein n=1 Tax=Kingdonia uniflora TaxID=39325 RepID=A0A7J7LN98_9MAGN|nr:hypothetical protein GIB67_007564 [Kingdonia uniflora]